MSGVIADTLAAHPLYERINDWGYACYGCGKEYVQGRRLSERMHAEHVEEVLAAAGVGDLRGLLAGFSQMADLAARVIEVHEHVAMDTAENKALHAKACATFGDLHAALLARYAPSDPTPKERQP